MKEIYSILSNSEDAEEEMEAMGISPWGHTPLGKLVSVSRNGDTYVFESSYHREWVAEGFFKASPGKSWEKALEIANKLATTSVIQMISQIEGLLTDPDALESLSMAPEANIVLSDATLADLSGLLGVLVKKRITEKGVEFASLIRPVQMLAQLQRLDGPFSYENVDFPPYPCFALPEASIASQNATITFYFLYQ
jgi:hypothetical protein